MAFVTSSVLTPVFYISLLNGNLSQLDSVLRVLAKQNDSVSEVSETPQTTDLLITFHMLFIPGRFPHIHTPTLIPQYCPSITYLQQDLN